MGFIGSMFSGDNGAGFHGSSTSLGQGTNDQQISDSYQQSQNILGQQQAFANAAGAQNGFGNQANVFAQQQGLADQLGMQAQGLGPNPALAQLNQTTGQNVANQSALMASQRGAGSNVGLMARQAAQQGANTQQQAVGQSAIMRAQQQLAAQQALQQQQANMGNMATQQIGQHANALGSLNQFGQNEQGQLLNALQGYNNSKVNMQANQNTVNAGIAGQNAKFQNGMVGAGMGTLGSLGGFAYGGQVPKMADGGMAQQIDMPSAPYKGQNNPQGPRSQTGQYLNNQSPQNNSMPEIDNSSRAGSQFGQGIMKLGQNLFNKISGSGSSGAPSADATGGNLHTGFNDQDWYDYAANKTGLPTDQETYSSLQSLPDASATDASAAAADPSLGAAAGADAAAGAEAGADAAGLAGAGAGAADAAAIGIGAGEAAGAASGLMELAPLAAALSRGGKVGGKAKIRGDNLKNDTVDAKLSPGEIVIPRSIAQGPDAPRRAAQFVQAVLARGGR